MPQASFSVVRTPQRTLPAYASGSALLAASLDGLFEHRIGLGGGIAATLTDFFPVCYPHRSIYDKLRLHFSPVPGGEIGAATPVGRGLISEDVINQVRDRVDIAEVVGHHVSLTRAGQNLKGLCPFHQEKSPSFTVSPSRQIFHCFGCGAGGNVFTFLMRITGANFPETVRELGQKFGIDVPDSGPSTGPHAAQANRLEPLNRAATTWFQQSLRDGVAGATARDYLASRGIRPETIEHFEIGCAPADWDGLIKALSKQGFVQSDVAAAGLTVAREHASGAYDRFRARVMFPIKDLRKRVVGFGGRILGEGTPKYLNSPDTLLFKKGQTLYALDLAREAVARLKTVIVVEGYFDAVALHQAGLTHTVATLGTALTAEHIQVLRRFASKVVLLFESGSGRGPRSPARARSVRK